MATAMTTICLISTVLFNFIDANRDKTGTNSVCEKEHGSQVVVCQALTSREKTRAERTGFEPADRVAPITDLANRRYRPLSHLSQGLKIRPDLGEPT